MQLLQTGVVVLPFDTAGANTIRALWQMKHMSQRSTAVMMQDTMWHNIMMNPSIRATTYTIKLWLSDVITDQHTFVCLFRQHIHYVGESCTFAASYMLQHNISRRHSSYPQLPHDLPKEQNVVVKHLKLRALISWYDSLRSCAAFPQDFGIRLQGFAPVQP